MYYDSTDSTDYGTGMDVISLDYYANGGGGGYDPTAGGGYDPTLYGNDPFINMTTTATSPANEPAPLADTSNFLATSMNGGVDTSSIAYDQASGLYYDINSGAYVDPTTGAPLVDTSTSTPAATTDPNFTDYGNGQSNYYDPNTGKNTFYDTNLGETTEVNADGSGQFTNAAGDVTVWTPEGVSTTTFADGGELIQQANGASQYTSPEGAVTNVDQYGNLISFVDPASGYSYDVTNNIWTEHYADGSSCSGDFSGNYCCSDGTCTPAWQDKATDKSTQRPAAQAGTGGAPKGSSGQQKAQAAQQAVQAALQRTTPTTTASQLASRQAALAAQQRAAAGLQPAAQSGINIGGTTISWVWIAIGAVALLAFTAKR